MKARNETAPGQGRGLEANYRNAKQSDANKIDGSLAMSHFGKADLLERAAVIMARAVFADRLASADVHTVEEGLRVLFEDGASYHRYKASKLRHGGHPLAFLEDAFGAAA